MKKEQVLAKLRSCGLVAVVRAKDADDAMRIAEACIEGGCAGIELTYTTPGVNAIIEKMAREYDGTDFVIGAGTVMDPETARMPSSPAPSMWSAPTSTATPSACATATAWPACPAP